MTTRSKATKKTKKKAPTKKAKPFRRARDQGAAFERALQAAPDQAQLEAAARAPAVQELIPDTLAVATLPAPDQTPAPSSGEMKVKVVVTDEPLNPNRVAAETAIITLRCKKPGARRAAKEGALAVKSTVDGGQGDPDEDSWRVSVDLLRSDEYLNIVRHDIQTRRYLMDQALPAGKRLASGSYLVLVAKVEDVYTRLAERKREREALVEKFLDAYPAIVEDAAERLKDAFDVAMFPGARMVEEPATGRIYVDVDDRAKALMSTAFSMEYELEVTDREAGLRAAKGSLSKAFVERELKRAKASAQALAEEIRDGMRAAFAQLVQRAAEMLKPTAGEKKVFRGESLERIQEFLGAFDSRNVAGDGDLAKVVAQARAVLAGVDVEGLKDAKDKAPRERLGEALGEVQKTLETLVATPRRRITLGEEG